MLRHLRIGFSQLSVMWKKYRVDIVIGLCGLLAMNAILLADAYRETKKINPTTAGEFGDFVGGYVGTAFALLSVLLLYRTLRSQREADQQQSFELRYFELIKLHRDNVEELKLQDIEGRRVFLMLFRELRAARRIVLDACQAKGLNLNQKQLLHIAYYSIFYGVGPGSSKMLKASLAGYDSSLIDQVERLLLDDRIRSEAQFTMKLPYTPFEGHQSRLGHYYRHLYQTVRYVDRQTIDIDKYDYVKTVRAQLSTHEQALLLVNSLSPVGASWWRDELMLNYRLVKNLPKHFLDPEQLLDLSTLFPKGYFEWEEIENPTSLIT